MFKKILLGCLVVIAIGMMPRIASANEYSRVTLTGVTSAVSSNSSAFYNAKVMAIRATNTAGVGVTNTITVYQVTTDNMTNTVAALTTTTAASTNVESSAFVQLRNDRLLITATSNFVAEVVFDNRSR